MHEPKDLLLCYVELNQSKIINQICFLNVIKKEYISDIMIISLISFRNKHVMLTFYIFF